jgi:hypothetical protein
MWPVSVGERGPDHFAERRLVWSARLEIENDNDDEYENDSEYSTAGRPRPLTDN